MVGWPWTGISSKPPVPLHVSLLDDYVEHNSYDENDDEYISDYIDLTLFAIVQNVERQTEYRSNPTDALREEIDQHSISITRAENCLNTHIQRIVRESDESCLEGRVYRAGKSCTLQVGKGRVQHFTRAQTRKTGKMISTMAQLKNCCLGGVRVRQEGEEKQRQFEVLSFPLFSLFLILTNKVYL